MLPIDCQPLLAAVRDARAARTAIASRGDAWGVALPKAYAIQAALLAGQPLAGYKLGLVSPAKQAQMGIAAPIVGQITTTMLGGKLARLDTFIQPRVEPEFAAVLGEDIAPGASPERAWVAVARLVLGLDLLDSVWAGYRFTAAEVVADNASGGALLLGPELPRDVRVGELTLLLDGRRLAGGPIAALGDLPARLAWLAQAAGGLRAGQVVFFGSPAAAAPVAPGLVEVHGPGGTTLRVRLR